MLLSTQSAKIVFCSCEGQTDIPSISALVSINAQKTAVIIAKSSLNESFCCGTHSSSSEDLLVLVYLDALIVD
jgi:hypothetical protein